MIGLFERDFEIRVDTSACTSVLEGFDGKIKDAWRYSDRVFKSGALVLLPVGSDDFVSHIADECIYLNTQYDVESLKAFYSESFGTD